MIKEIDLGDVAYFRMEFIDPLLKKKVLTASKDCNQAFFDNLSDLTDDKGRIVVKNIFFKDNKIKNIRNVVFEDCVFENTKLLFNGSVNANLKFTGCVGHKSSFINLPEDTEMDFKGTNINMDRCKFAKTILKISLIESKVTGLTLGDNKKFSNFSFSKFKKCTFNNCWFINIGISDSNFIECNFEFVKFENVDFRDTKLNGSSFSECFLFHPKFHSIYLGESGENDDQLGKYSIELRGLDSFTNWSNLRGISSFPLFSISWITLAFTLGLIAAIMSSTQITQNWPEPFKISFHPSFRLLLLAIGSFLLAFSSSIFAFFCPPEIQSYSLTQWVYSQNKRQLPYLVISTKYRLAQYICLLTLILGGTIALWLMLEQVLLVIDLLFS
ncbi:pentapeptide repeat-containing protein [Marinicella sediminis]|uniref:Pentapeptide repeat-containing protein n=1 Tax=Marinicella sediminis TaxID=1792834 RepID=A0ABV7J572_9GAMM|nr:pentapeptide repeat-containing protein [Marinicella sediminis]